MTENAIEFLRKELKASEFAKLEKVKDTAVHEIIAKYIRLCKPSGVFVATDDPADWEYIRQSALTNQEEHQLTRKMHTIHFDAYKDQGRDKANTSYLVDDLDYLEPELNSRDRNKGLEEIYAIMNGIMKGREVFICFFSLGPVGSEFSIPCLQMTDSAYVAHSERLLYRTGYSQFTRGLRTDFFKLIHSQGETQEAGLGLMVCKNLDKRRVFIDLKDETVLSVNTQYGGNTIGLKKLSMRLAIARASREGWLTEHMFLMSVTPTGGKKVFLTGAYPSMCGKTSTSMLRGETILGDDIVYMRNVGGEIRAVNVERGMFGIIHGVNSEDDPLQWKALKNGDNEIIFSNVLVKDDGSVYWEGMDGDCPVSGVNHYGQWKKGMVDTEGKTIPPSHKNARFSIPLECLDNVDSLLESPEGVVVNGIIYGGRDSEAWVPVEEAFGWDQGIITKGACLESETTAATLGKAGVRVFNPMSNLDFLSVPIGKYIKMNLDFGKKLKSPPKIFATNYFLKDDKGEYMNSKRDKHVWLKWIALRVQGAVEGVETPTGIIPRYEDLRVLFHDTLGKHYSREDYVRQFSFRCMAQIQKLDRITKIYRENVKNTPPELFEIIEQQRARIEKKMNEKGNCISPLDLFYGQ